jgi:holo-[acyl-carrier protein] synthase
VTTWTPAGALRVGTDLVDVADVADSVARFGRAYLDRVFTPGELASTRRDPVADGDQPAADGLAARFAAKEAVIKVLRPGDARPDWRTIEIHRSSDGWCEVTLSGAAAELAEAAGLDDLAVSMTHEGGMASAVAVGRCSGGRRTVGSELEAAEAMRPEGLKIGASDADGVEVGASRTDALETDVLDTEREEW